MKSSILSIAVATVFFALSCNSNKNSNSGDSSATKEAKVENTKSDNTSETDIASTTVRAKFKMVVAGTSGAIFMFEDETGKSLKLYENADSKGLEFTHGLQPNMESPKFKNTWFEVRYADLPKEFRNSEAGSVELRNVPMLVEVKEASESTDGLNAESLKKMQFSGTEPFWSVKFSEEYATYSSPEDAGTKIYYKKSYGDTSKPKLTSAIVKKSADEIEIQGSFNGVGVLFTIKKGSCSDGMSEEKFTHTIDFMIDEYGSMKGCGK